MKKLWTLWMCIVASSAPLAVTAKGVAVGAVERVAVSTGSEIAAEVNTCFN